MVKRTVLLTSFPFKTKRNQKVYLVSPFPGMPGSIILTSLQQRMENQNCVLISAVVCAAVPLLARRPLCRAGRRTKSSPCPAGSCGRGQAVPAQLGGLSSSSYLL